MKILISRALNLNENTLTMVQCKIDRKNNLNSRCIGCGCKTFAAINKEEPSNLSKDLIKV